MPPAPGLAQGRAMTRPPAQAGWGQAAFPALALGGLPRPPRLGIYMGGGASHSWLWFVQTFERLGLSDLALLDERDIAGGGLDGLEALAVSGGDTFALAAALGPLGAAHLEGFIRGGGLYLGSCAGAYLCLRSSKHPLNLFNFVAARISNLSRDLAPALELPDKYRTPYGCSWVFHPVREAVRMEAKGPYGENISLEAPLYGGPAMLPDDPGLTLATYAGFTPATRFLAAPELAAQTLLGKAAILRAPLGRGWLHLYGPHVEHPRFHAANQMLMRALARDLDWGASQPRPTPRGRLEGREARDLLREIKRGVSNCRVAALGLEDHPARWMIGHKLYEPAKLRVFVEAAWGALRKLERAGWLPCAEERAQELAQAWGRLTEEMRGLKPALERGEDTLERARAIFAALPRACAGVLQMHFSALAVDGDGADSFLPNRRAV